MPIPVPRDLEQARLAIQTWLGDQRPEAASLSVSELSSPGMTGFSNETLMFDVSWSQDGRPRSESLVIRVKPTGHRIFLEDDFDLQYQVMSELGRRGAPVPPVHWYEPDASVLGAPFFVMAKMAGEAPGDVPSYNAEGFIFDMRPAERHRLWVSAMEALVRIHRESMTGGFEFLAKPERGSTGLDQQMHYYEESLGWAAAGRPQPVAEAAWDWLIGHLPAERPTALSWGDARMANMLFEGSQCRAVLDWEMLSLGGPRMDLGWWLFLDRFSSEGMSLDRLDGLGTRDETIAFWSEGTGLAAEDLEFYEIFAGLRFAVIMIRMARMFEAWDVPAPGDMETNNGATQVLARLLDLEPPGDPW